jgi:hypothetical protein
MASNGFRAVLSVSVLEGGQRPLESILVALFFGRCVHSPGTDHLVSEILIGYHAISRGVTQDRSP